MSGRRWTDDEVALVEDLFDTRGAAYVAERLGRTLSAVRCKADQLGVSCKPVDVFSMNELTTILGTDHHQLRRWLREGEIPSTFTEGRGRYGEWRVREEDLVAWLRAKPWMVDRDRVEPAYRGLVSERYITLAEAHRRGAAHASALTQAALAGLVPNQRRRGLFWVVPESTLPALIGARRLTVDDATHRRQLVRYERTRRVYEAKRKTYRRAT